MVKIEERTTDWIGTIKSFLIGSTKLDNNEEYKKWKEMNATDVNATNKIIKGLEEETSAPKNGGVTKKKRKSSKTQAKSTQMPTNNRKIGKANRQRNDGGISR